MDAHLSLIQDRVSSFIIPAGIGRIPHKIKSCFAEFTADQWKNWVVYSLISMRDIIVGEELVLEALCFSMQNLMLQAYHQR